MNALSYRCKPVDHPLRATVRVPGSKSITNRALVAAALAEGRSLLQGVLVAEDTRIMVEVLNLLGISVSLDEEDCAAEITGCHGQIPACDARLYCGNAGTVIRFCAAMAALGRGRFELDGAKRMRERPIGELVEGLRQLGGAVEYADQEGFPPVIVHARGLRGGEVAFTSPQSSQFVSALLLAAPYAAGDVFVRVSGSITSAPYLRMTTAVMRRMGVEVVEQYEGGEARFIVASHQSYHGANLRVEGDATNAAYFLAAPAVAGGRVSVSGIGTDSIQGDARFVDVLERMGCSVEREKHQLTVIGPSNGHLRGIDVDLNDMPDTAQTLAVTALFADGPTTIRNVPNLRVKETDRIEALRCELEKLGAAVEEMPDGVTIHPPATIRPAAIDTYDDHRMAMSFALAGLKVPLEIDDPQCCEKTFPSFFELFEQMIRDSA